MTRKLVFTTEPPSSIPTVTTTTATTTTTTAAPATNGLAAEPLQSPQPAAAIAPTITETVKQSNATSSSNSSSSNKKQQQQQQKSQKMPPPVPPPRFNKIITSFEELGHLKARSRIPIDIHHHSANHHAVGSSSNPYGNVIGPAVGTAALINFSNDAIFRSSRTPSTALHASPKMTTTTTTTTMSSDNQSLVNHSRSSAASSGSASSSSSTCGGQEALSTATCRLRANLPTLSASINFSSLIMSSSLDARTNSCGDSSNSNKNCSGVGVGSAKPMTTTTTAQNNVQQQPQPKYFSFMTTNKLFSNYTSQAMLRTSHNLSNQVQAQQPNIISASKPVSTTSTPTPTSSSPLLMKPTIPATTPPMMTSPSPLVIEPVEQQQQRITLKNNNNNIDDDGMASTLSSSSSSNDGGVGGGGEGDSGCGCSLARSSILSQCCDFNAVSAAETAETASTKSGSSCFSDAAASSSSRSSGIGSSSSEAVATEVVMAETRKESIEIKQREKAGEESSSQDDGDEDDEHDEHDDDANDEEKERVKTLCEKIYNTNAKLNKMMCFSSMLHSSTVVNQVASLTATGGGNNKQPQQLHQFQHADQNNNKPNPTQTTYATMRRPDKILTVLFDYETPSHNKFGFSVKQGEQLKVIRDYDETYYLVAVISTGRIGFIPKDYTVDLKEVRKRVKQQEHEHMSSYGTEIEVESSSVKFYQAVKAQNAKLTKL